MEIRELYGGLMNPFKPTIRGLHATFHRLSDNPGLTLLHCHMQEHMDFGFMNLVKYVY
jgi:FtsP/CotA-like multicopper oxidase with cupredoxin domain